MCTHAHTRARGVQRGPSASFSAATPPVGDALRRVQSQWIYAVSCKARSILPIGGVIAEGVAEGPPRTSRACARVRVCVCVHIHL